MKKKSERIIHLNEMLEYILKHWKIFIIGMAVTGILFGCMGMYKVNEKYSVVPRENQTSKEIINVSEAEVSIINLILNLEQMIVEQRDYNVNSILMKVNPYEKKIASVKYQFQTSGNLSPEIQERRLDQGKKAYQSVFNDDELYEYIKNHLSLETEGKYIKELIGIEVEAKGIIVISLTAPSKEMAQKIIEAIKKYFADNEENILGNYKDLNVKIDSEYCVTVIDAGLMGTQTSQYNVPQNLQAQIDAQYLQLSDNAKQYLVLAREAYQEGSYESGQPLYKEVSFDKEVSITRKLYEVGIYTIKRMALFICLFFLVFSLKYMWSPRLMYAYDLQDMYGIRVFDELSVYSDESIDIIAEKILSCTSNINDVLLISSDEGQKTLNIMQKLKQVLESKGIIVRITADLNNVNVIQTLGKSNCIVMVENIGRSKYSAIEGIIREVQNLNKGVKGAVIISA